MIEKLKKIKIYFWIIAVIFFIFFGVGVAFNFINPKETAEFFTEISKSFSFINDLNFFTTFLFIFLNNTIKVLIILVLGALFGVIPILFTAINGFVLGLVLGHVFPKFGWGGLLVSIAFHGIFELFALFVSGGAGLFLGVVAYQELKRGNANLTAIKKFEWSEKLKSSFQLTLDLFVFIVLPALLLAALIESLLIFIV